MFQKKEIVVFDFDGTLSAKDTNREFVKYCFKHSLRPWLFLPWMLVAGIARFFNRDGVWWRENIRAFYTPELLKRFLPVFIKQHKRERFGWAKERVEIEKSAGRKVILVSASPDYVLPKLVSDIKFDAVLCSITYKDKPWKYRFLCWGQNKVLVLDEWAKENNIIPDVVRAYSDSKSDMPLMEIAKEQVWIDAKTGLRKQA